MCAACLQARSCAAAGKYSAECHRQGPALTESKQLPTKDLKVSITGLLLGPLSLGSLIFGGGEKTFFKVQVEKNLNALAVLPTLAI